MKIVSFVVAMVIASACNKANPNYCPGNPDNNCLLDGPTGDGPHGCTTQADCAVGVCDTGLKQCVQCTTAIPTACTGTTPVCGTDDKCGACAMDSQCASQVCMPDGSCADGSTVLYATPMGSNVATCGLSDKCSIDHAVSLVDPTRALIRLDSGMYALSGTLSLTKNLTMIGRGAIIDKTGGSNGAAIAISGNSTVSLFYVTVEGGSDSTIGYGVSCQSSTVIARMVTIQNNASIGINGVACNLTLAQSLLTSNTGGGISVSGNAISFDLTNSFVTRNGNPNSATCGGVNLAVTNPMPSRFEFNTIADNQAATGVTHSGGVICDLVSFTSPNNIIARNSINQNTTAPSAQSLGTCTYPTSAVQNDVVGLAFLSSESSPYDYRIGVASIAIDQALTVSTIDVDVDGIHRPQQMAKDIGASEYKP